MQCGIRKAEWFLEKQMKNNHSPEYVFPQFTYNASDTTSDFEYLNNNRLQTFVGRNGGRKEKYTIKQKKKPY